MTIDLCHHNAIAVLTPRGPHLSKEALPALQRMMEARLRAGTRAVLLDLIRVPALTDTGLTTVLELGKTWQTGLGRLPGRMVFGICGLNRADWARFSDLGLARHLPLYPTRAAALLAPEFRRQSLAGTKAVVLSPPPDTRLAPMTRDRSLAMLDVLGRPLVDRVVSHLQRHGIRDIILGPAPFGRPIADHFSGRRDLSLTHLLDGWDSAGSDAPSRLLGPAGTLARLHRAHAAFDGDTLVVEVGVLSDMDLGRVMSTHRSSAAAATVAVLDDGLPPRRRVTGPRQSSCAYVFSPQVFELAGTLPPDSGPAALVRLVRASGGRVRFLRHGGFGTAVTCGREFAALLHHGLRGQCEDLVPTGEQVAPGIWIDPTARVASLSSLKGRVHVGARARIHAEASVLGHCVVGAGCDLQSHSLARDSILWPETRLTPGAIVDGAIADGTWAVDHHFADGQPRSSDGLERVEPAADGAGVLARSA